MPGTQTHVYRTGDAIQPSQKEKALFLFRNHNLEVSLAGSIQIFFFFLPTVTKTELFRPETNKPKTPRK